MQNPSRAFLLGPLLKGVSRSFYLTLNVLPAGMREPVGLAYLLARAADTIADTSLIPPAQRLEWLLALRERVNGGADDGAFARMATEVAAQQTQSDEKVLLESLEPALALLASLDAKDGDAVREIVTTLTSGMELDLRTFPDERSGDVAALRELAELDRYTYLVAGCVGEFWTKMSWAHVPSVPKDTRLLERGVRFGKALQLTNVLRDCGKDLRIGRCYLPGTLLDRFGLSPRDLLDPRQSRRALPVLRELVPVAIDHYRAALDYALAMPRRELRLRLAALWPIFIGLETLALLAANDAWLDPQRVSKVTRAAVYRILAASTLLVWSDSALRAWAASIVRRIETALASTAGVSA